MRGRAVVVMAGLAILLAGASLALLVGPSPTPPLPKSEMPESIEASRAKMEGVALEGLLQLLEEARKYALSIPQAERDLRRHRSQLQAEREMLREMEEELDAVGGADPPPDLDPP